MLDAEQVAAAGKAAERVAVVPDKAQRSFTDPDARIMKTSDGSFHYCYNAQAIVDERCQVVLAGALRQSGADCPALPDMLDLLTAALAAAGIVGRPAYCWPPPVTSPPPTLTPLRPPGSTR